VFLFATAQLRVDTIDGKLSDLKDHVIFLQDRFPRGGRLILEERDIDTVVRERWLKKDERSPHWPELAEKLRQHGGTLANAAKLRDVAILRESSTLLTDPEAVAAYYPCLPYHIQLLQEILSALQRDEQLGQTSAQSRALLTAVRSLFLAENGGKMADAELGTLVTFDVMYEVIRDVVNRADNDTHRWITDGIDALGAVGTIRLGAAARVIFLLQQLNPRGGRPKVRVSAENVAALLYPRLGAPWEPHARDVRGAIEELARRNFIDEEPEAGWRFYRADEKTFREALKGFVPNDGEIRATLKEAAEQEAKQLGMRSVARASGHHLDVAVTAHTHAVTLPDGGKERSGLELHFAWIPAEQTDAQIQQWKMRFADTPSRMVWVLRGDGEAEALAREMLQLAAAIKEHDRKHGHQALEALRGERKKLDDLRERRLPEAVARAIAEGTVVHSGQATSLVGGAKAAPDVFKQRMAVAVDRVFTQIEEGDVAVQDPEKVLGWKSSQPLPEPYRRLRLFDASNEQVLLDGAFLKELQIVIRAQPEKDRTGKALLERLRAIPYGWPEGAVKAGLGALLRARRIRVRQAGSPDIVTADERAEHWLRSVQTFNKSVIEPKQIGPTPEEIAKLAVVLGTAFMSPGLDTLEKQERAIGDLVSPALLLEADRVIERDGRCFGSYARAYRKRHEDLASAAARARAKVEADPAWAEQIPEVQRSLRESIPLCDAPGDLVLATSPDGRCPACGQDHKGLALQHELVESRLSAALRRMAPRPSTRPPPPPPPPRIEVSLRVQTEADIPDALGRIEVELRKAALPARVTVTVEDGER
jgi:hypothetical protein